MLVEQGSLQWDRPITNYLPHFHLKDPVATKEMTLRDLLSHRTGLPDTSTPSWRLWYHTNRSSEELIRRLAYVDPIYSFRTHFSYNNVAYAIAGQIIETVSGSSYPQLCEQKIFSPLGMTRTSISYDRLIHTHEQKDVSYGLGWDIYSLGGKKVLLHTGVSDGMQSACAIVPEEQLGIAILTNQGGHYGTSCLLNLLLDRFLDQPPVLWHQKAHAIGEKIDQSIREARKRLEEQRGEIPPSLSIEKYVGHYEHPAYGSIWVHAENGQLTIETWTHEKGFLRHWDGDRFEITDFPSFGALPVLIDFAIDLDGEKVSGLTYPELGFFCSLS